MYDVYNYVTVWTCTQREDNAHESWARETMKHVDIVKGKKGEKKIIKQIVAHAKGNDKGPNSTHNFMKHI